MVSNPYCLLGRKNAGMFRLLPPSISETAPGAAGSSVSMTGTLAADSDCNELVRFLKDKGLSAIAARFSEAMGMELVEDLRMLQTEDLDDPDLSFLKRWQKEKLLVLARNITARSASLRDSMLNDSGLSAADTASERSDTASEGGDDIDLTFDTVLIRHPDNPADFQEHMTGFVSGFLAYMKVGVEADDEWNTYDVDLNSTGRKMWTWSMLLWIRFARDAARHLDE